METPNHEANSQIEDLKNALQEIEKENRISKTRIDNMQTSIEQQNQQIEDQQFDIKALEKVLLRALEVQGKPHEVIIKMRKKHLQEMSETTGAMSVEKEKVTYYLPQPDDSIKTIEEPYKEYELRGKQPTEEILKNKTQFNKARAGLIADNESEETESLFW